MKKKNLLVFFIIIFILGISKEGYCPLFGSSDYISVFFSNPIPWKPEIIDEWNKKVIEPLKKLGDTSVLGSHYKLQKDGLDITFEDWIKKAETEVKKQECQRIKRDVNVIYDHLNRKNAQQVLSTLEQENYHTRYFLVSLKKIFGLRYFEVVVNPGERKEVVLPLKGPIIDVYRFEDAAVKDFFKQQGEEGYLHSQAMYDQGVYKFRYDAEKREKLAEQTLFPEKHYQEGSRLGKKAKTLGATGPSLIPLDSFVEDNVRRNEREALLAGPSRV